MAASKVELVIYFYSPTPMTAKVSVDFPNGSTTEWFPNASGIVSNRVSWPEVKVQPAASPEFPSEFASSHYYAARLTDAAPLAVEQEQEKFLFYRGVGNFNRRFP